MLISIQKTIHNLMILKKIRTENIFIHSHSSIILYLFLFSFYFLFSNNLHSEKKIASKVITKCNINIYNLFDRILPSGNQPIKVEIQNDQNKKITWEINFQSHGDSIKKSITTNKKFSVKPLSSGTFIFDIPIITSLKDKGYTRNRLHINGFCYNESSSQFRNDIYYISRGGVPIILASKKLITPISSKLNLKYHNYLKTNRFYTGSSPNKENKLSINIDVNNFPKKWNSYTGVDFIFLKDNEWNDLLPSSSRQAILSWVHMGGQLYIFSEEFQNKNKLKWINHDRKDKEDIINTPLGLGHIKRFAYNSIKEQSSNISSKKSHNTQKYEFPYNLIFDKISISLKDKHNKRLHLAKFSYPDNNLFNKFGIKKNSHIFIIIIFFIYCIVIGPINLFIIEKKKNRLFIFISIPILATITSLFIIIYIFIKDGLGGKGYRYSLIVYQEDLKSSNAILFQNHFARTGLLFNNKFKIKKSEDIYLWPLFLQNIGLKNNVSPSSSIKNKSNAYYKIKSDNINDKFEGWYFNRSLQGHYLIKSFPTRDRVENKSYTKGNEENKTEINSPNIIWTMDYEISSIFYIDNNKALWQSEGTINKGNKINLTPIEKNNKDNNLKEKIINLIDINLFPNKQKIINLIDNYQNYENYFIAIAKNEKKLFVNTLQSIKWKDQQSILIGKIKN